MSSTLTTRSSQCALVHFDGIQAVRKTVFCSLNLQTHAIFFLFLNVNSTLAVL